jgi:hypothetical protein
MLFSFDLKAGNACPHQIRHPAKNANRKTEI